jgi:hypothetical protein
MSSAMSSLSGMLVSHNINKQQQPQKAITDPSVSSSSSTLNSDPVLHHQTNMDIKREDGLPLNLSLKSALNWVLGRSHPSEVIHPHQNPNTISSMSSKEKK